MDRLILGLIVVFGVPAATVFYAWIIESLLGRLPTALSQRLRPWLWLLPALVLLFFSWSIRHQHNHSEFPRMQPGMKFVGLDNYRYAFSSKICWPLFGII